MSRTLLITAALLMTVCSVQITPAQFKIPKIPDHVVIPVQVVGDFGGTWDRNAWKTGAFYGNPLAGFVAP